MKDFNNNILTDLQKLNLEANKLVEAIHLADGQLKEFLITDLYELVSDITRWNCTTFLREYNVYSLVVGEAFEIAMGEALHYALKSYDPSKGVYFLSYYRRMVNWVLLRHIEKLNAQKRIKQKDFISIDDEENLINNLEYQISSNQNPSEVILTKIEFQRVLSEFIKLEPYGAIVLCEQLDREARKRAILKILGAENYGPLERKKVERIRKSLRNFLVENDFKII